MTTLLEKPIDFQDPILELQHMQFRRAQKGSGEVTYAN